ncbi:MAG: peptidoglycan-binding protein [Clostridia bacterium]|nr:peptidoglycan-binding protein [Clostridia bacterium]
MNNIDNRDAVREIQQYLRTVSSSNSSVRRVEVDGIFGPETQQAVRDFQRAFGLPQTGRVDTDTWNELYAQYLRVLAETAAAVQITAFQDPRQVLRIGDRDERVIFLQIMLNALANRFAGLGAVGSSGVYDQKTSDAVKNLQSAAGLDQNGETDKMTWDFLASLYNTGLPQWSENRNAVQ